MNNMNTPVYLIISNRFKINSEAFYVELKRQAIKQLANMNRLFSSEDLEQAVSSMDYLKFTLCGVDFRVLRG